MKRVTMIAAVCALAIAACGGQTAQQACSDHDGLNQRSLEADVHKHKGHVEDNGFEGRCNDGAEIENPQADEPGDVGWAVD